MEGLDPCHLVTGFDLGWVDHPGRVEVGRFADVAGCGLGLAREIGVGGYPGTGGRSINVGGVCRTLAREVREQRESSGDPDDEEAEPRGDVEQHREDRPDHPDDLEARLEAGERTAAVGIGGVTLDERVERQLAGGRCDGH